MRNKLYGAFVLFVAIIIVMYMATHSTYTDNTVFQGYVEVGLEHSQVKNLVTSVLLDYRVFDTLFEALLLLVSIVAIFSFTSLEPHENCIHSDKFTQDESYNYTILRFLMSIVYPLFIVLGVYIIVNGADSPGGGFQGGAILATLIMSRYIVTKETPFGSFKPYAFEKIIYLFIIVLTGAYLLGFIESRYIRQYMLLMNIFIGLKVASGFSAIIIKFMKGDTQ